jgi:hypothetical protein
MRARDSAMEKELSSVSGNDVPIQKSEWYSRWNLKYQQKNYYPKKNGNRKSKQQTLQPTELLLLPYFVFEFRCHFL